MGARIQIHTQIPNATPQFIQQGVLYYSQKNKILALSDLNHPQPRLIATIPWRRQQHLSHFRLAERVLRNSIIQLHRSANGLFLAMTGHTWWRIDPSGDVCKVLPPSDTRPMSRGICELRDNTTYIADYFKNTDRGPVRIYRSSDLKYFEPCWEFSAGSIRHIHALVCDDEIRNRIWILTGDTDDESAIWYTDNAFRNVQLFLRAGQLSRLVDIVPGNGSLLWGTDSHYKLNYICECSKLHGSKPKKIQQVPGPVYYSGRNAAGAIYFGTTVERGEAVLDDYGHIFGLTPQGGWQEVFRAKNDRTSQHGILYFPRGTLPENWLVFSQRALIPGEGCMYLARDNAW